MVIDMEHKGPLDSHLAAKRVFLTMRGKYHFPRMEHTITNRIKKCLPCQLHMYTTTKPHKLNMTTHTTTPRTVLGIDIAPDLPPDRGYNHLLVFLDFATNHVSLHPIKSRSSPDLLHAFQNYIKEFGIPHIVRHDNEKGLVHGEFHQFCEDLLIEQVQGLPNKGQTNGKIESQIRNIKYALRSTTTANATKHCWIDHIWKIQHSLNKAVSVATNMSPEMAMFGHEIPLRKTTIISQHSIHDHNPLQSRLPLIARQTLLQQRVQAQQSRLTQQNQTRTSNTYAIGDIVWKRIMQRTGPGVKHALEARYTGPFEITAISGSTVTLDSPLAKFTVPVQTHIDQLKPYCSTMEQPAGPAWDNTLRTSLNIQRDPVASRTRKRSRDNTEQSDTEAPTKNIRREQTPSPSISPTRTDTSHSEHSSDFPSPTESEQFCWDINDPAQVPLPDADQPMPAATEATPEKETASGEIPSTDQEQEETPLDQRPNKSAQIRSATQGSSTQRQSSPAVLKPTTSRDNRPNNTNTATSTDKQTDGTTGTKDTQTTLSNQDKSTQTSGFYLIHT